MGTDDRPRAFVPDGFTVPRELITDEFRLEPAAPGSHVPAGVDGNVVTGDVAGGRGDEEPDGVGDV
jgi:hypothetical protein